MNNYATLCDLLLTTCKESGIEPALSENPSNPSSPARPSPPQLTDALVQAIDWVPALDRLKQTILNEFHFTRMDYLIIAALFQQHYLYERPLSVVRLLKSVAGKKSASLAHANQVLRLVCDGIFTLHRTGAFGGQLPTGLVHATYGTDDDILQGHELSLSKTFLGFLIDEQRPPLVSTAYRTNREFLLDAFQCCYAAQRYFNVPPDQWRIELFDIRAEERYNNLLERLNLTETEIPFRTLAQEYGLTDSEQLALLHLLERESFRQTSDIGQMSRTIDADLFDRVSTDAVLLAGGTLRKNGLIDVRQEKTPQGISTLFNIEPGLFQYLVSAGMPNGRHNSRNICAKNSAITVCRPTKSIENLILPCKEMTLLSTIINSCKTDHRQILQQWGIIQNEPGSGNAQQLLILLYGRPGVGKTLAAEVIANEIGKELMRIDVSQIRDKWIGESEKNLRSVFVSYQECLRRSPNPPILFLNECDQFLTRRIENVAQSADQLLNTMQNMLLEFLENFSGICIATTNLISNLDPAFSRRFTHKIELPWPDPATRERLWGTLVPSTLPLGADFDTRALAEEYSFSGSQIKTVIYNAALEAANRPPDGRIVTQSDLIKHADLESSGSFDGSRLSKIGFGSSESRKH